MQTDPQSSDFDPALFLDSATTEAAVRRPPLTVGDYVATIGEPTSRKGERKDQTGPWYAVTFPIIIEAANNPQVAWAPGSGFPKVTINDMVMLDTTPNGLDWSPGKNGRLRRYRDATGLNVQGATFTVRSLQGRPIKVKVKHDTYQGEIQERVDSVAAPQ